MYEISRRDLKGQKDIRTGKGYEQRSYSYTTNDLEKFNNHILILQFLLKKIGYILSLDEQEKESYSEELKELDSIDFIVQHSSE